MVIFYFFCFMMELVSVMVMLKMIGNIYVVEEVFVVKEKVCYKDSGMLW